MLTLPQEKKEQDCKFKKIVAGPAASQWSWFRVNWAEQRKRSTSQLAPDERQGPPWMSQRLVLPGKTLFVYMYLLALGSFLSNRLPSCSNNPIVQTHATYRRLLSHGVNSQDSPQIPTAPFNVTFSLLEASTPSSLLAFSFL